MGRILNDIDHEGWHQVHAQLLKSVADAQAKLLAAQNETCDKVESTSRNLGLMEQRLSGRLEKTEALAFSNHALHCSIEKKVFALNGKLDAIGAILAELLTGRRPVARPTKRKRRR